MSNYIMRKCIASGRLSAVALVVMTAAFIAPHTASADTGDLRVPFSYDKSAPAEKIYSEFRVRAMMVCKEDSPRPISLRAAEKRCAADLLDKAVAKLGRADVATLHQGGTALIASR